MRVCVLSFLPREWVRAKQMRLAPGLSPVHMEGNMGT